MANDAERFRQALPEALALWVAEELIAPAQAEAIRAYYRPDEAPIVAARTFAASLRWAAGVLAGLGLLALGAANWEAIAIDVRLGLAVGTLVVTSLLGFTLLDREGQAGWGRTALVVASFALAAAAATIAQRWQLGGDGGEVWGAWAAGTLLMAWAAQAGGVACVAALALTGFALTAPAGWGWLAPCGFALLLPLAYRVDLRPLLYVALGGLPASLVIMADGAGAAYLVAFAAIPGLLGWQAWHLQRLPYQRLERAVIRRDPGDALLALTEAEYVRRYMLGLGFGLPAIGALLASELPLHVPQVTWEPAFGAALGVSVAAAFAAWALTGKQAPGQAAHVVAGVGAAACCFAIAAEFPPTWQVATFVLAAMAAALGIAADGVRLGDSNWFWTGVVTFAWGVVGMFLLASQGEPLVLGAGMVAGAAVVAGASKLLERRGWAAVGS